MKKFFENSSIGIISDCLFAGQQQPAKSGLLKSNHMRKISAVLFTTLVAVASSPTFAHSVMPLVQHIVNPSSSENYGIKVHVLDSTVSCNGKQFYVSAPIDANRTWLQVRSAASDEVVVDTQSGVLEMMPYPEKDQAWLAKTDFGFLAKGFRGINFCLTKELVSRTTLSFTSKTDIWDIGALTQWYKDH